jgi:Flp pilus assembly protein TadB
MGVATGWSTGGLPGPVVGLCVASAAWFGLGYLESKAGLRPRVTNSPAVPLVAELMSAAVAAGCPPVVAAEAVADALGGPVGAVLRSTVAAVRLGSDPGTAWLGLGATDPAFRPLARALASSATWGTSPNEMLDRAARDARDTARWAAEARARSLGARAAAPLGLCFLPAFVLVGIVPLVVTAAAPLLP